MTKKEKICKACGQPMNQCICCDACSHTCMLDFGEPYCPVCFPEPENEQDE